MINDEYTNERINNDLLEKTKRGIEAPERAYIITPKRYNLRDANWLP